MDELRRMFRYNAWANAKIIGSAARLSTEQAALPIEGIYGSVADTERHMLQVEHVYLKLMGADAPEFARGPDEASFTELASALGSAYDVFLSSLSETALGRRFLVPWFEHEITIRDGLIQVATHSTEHRADLASGVSRLGVSTPALDYVVWVLEAEV